MTVPPDIALLIDGIGNASRQVQGEAFLALCARTELPGPWADAAWDDLMPLLDHRNNRTRAIAGQLLSRLASRTLPARVARDLPRIVAATRDTHFVTGRHILQSLARIALASPPLPGQLFDLLAERFRTCGDEKNATLIRYDIQLVMRAIHDRDDDVSIRRRALDLTLIEDDLGYRKKYLGCWK